MKDADEVRLAGPVAPDEDVHASQLQRLLLDRLEVADGHLLEESHRTVTHAIRALTTPSSRTSGQLRVGRGEGTSERRECGHVVPRNGFDTWVMDRKNSSRRCSLPGPQGLPIGGGV